MLVSMCSNLQISRLNCEVEGSLGARVKSHHNLVVEYWVFAAAFSHTVANRSHITQTTSCLPPGSCLYICPPASCLYICPPPSCLLHSRTTCSVLLIHCQAGSAPGHFSDLLFNGKIVLFLFVIQYCPSTSSPPSISRKVFIIGPQFVWLQEFGLWIEQCETIWLENKDRPYIYR